ncbi:unnamed protein product [Spirodela intermedia]|uniref:Uncharacterized protein n=1 Tax=Spirodela intermedia TaxID=51605 RepID=A0A7I8JIJ1_SPIIN|nr:unnamed protein product [Spirodela intermedia]CAA6669575.1 unnamed protein product [Spirodela intermedia]
MRATDISEKRTTVEQGESGERRERLRERERESPAQVSSMEERDDSIEKGDSTPLLRIEKKFAGVGCLESLGYFGISTNLVIFLGDVLHQSNPSIATSIMSWTGTSFLAPFLGALVADSYCGGYCMILASSIELIGMFLVTLSSILRSSATPQRVIFFSGLYMVALGSGGVKSSLLPLGGRKKKSSFFNWFYFSLNLGALVSSTFVVWTEENVGWAVGFGGAAVAMAAALGAFLSGTKIFRLRTTTKGQLGRSFRAAELKFLLRLLPFWLTGVVFSAAYAHIYTTFVEQGKAMDGKIASFCVPPASLFAFEVASVMAWLVVVPAAAPPLLQRMGIGYSLMAAAVATAAAVEMKRVKSGGAAIAWQLPQYFLVGGAEAFACVGQLEFFYSEAPVGMRSMSTAISLLGISLGSYLSSAAMATLAASWVPKDLSEGHLGYLFSALTGLCVANLIAFSVFARRYTLKRAAAGRL